MNKYVYGFLVTTTLIGLSACSSEPGFSQKDLKDKGQYWQRTSASSAAYMRGPKAQQILNRDISTCVVELKELQRLGTFKDAFPAGVDHYGHAIDMETPEGRIASFDTPERDQTLLTEVFDYTDFESCMFDKGWERVEYLPYDRASAARKNYTTSILEPLKPPPVEEKPYDGRSYPEQYGYND